MTRTRAVDRWRADPIRFIESVLHDPETNKPFKLLPAERDFLAYAFKLDVGGRLLYQELVVNRLAKLTPALPHPECYWTTSRQ